MLVKIYQEAKIKAKIRQGESLRSQTAEVPTRRDKIKSQRMKKLNNFILSI